MIHYDVVVMSVLSFIIITLGMSSRYKFEHRKTFHALQ